MGGPAVKITYDETKDLLYFRLDERFQQVVNRRIDDDIVLDLGDGDRIVGIEILDASRRIRLDELLPVAYEKTA